MHALAASCEELRARTGNPPLIHVIKQNRTTKQNKTKQNKTKRNETKRNETKRNETKRNITERNETKALPIKAHFNLIMLPCG